MAHSCSASVIVQASGFSTKTCLPPSSARDASSAWIAAGAAIATPAISSSRNTASNSTTLEWCRSASWRTALRSGSQIAARAPSSAKLRTRFLPQYPQPIAATRTGQFPSRPAINGSFGNAFPHATAVRVTGMSPEHTAPPPRRDRFAAPSTHQGSGGFHYLGAELRSHRAAEQLEKHDDPVLIAQLDQTADHVLERARRHTHQL